MSKEPDELDKLLRDMFVAWKEDVESVEQPVLVTDDEAVEIILKAAHRTTVKARIRRIMGWI